MALSYACAPNPEPCLYKTNVDMMKLWAKLYPDKDAFVEYTAEGDRKSLSCAELLIKAKQFGGYLISNGVQKGDVVLLCMKNSLQMVIAICGVSFCGGIVSCTSLNKENGSDVIEQLSDTKAKILVIDTNNSDLTRCNVIKAILNSNDTVCLSRIICNNGDGILEESNGVVASFEKALNEGHDQGDDFPDVFPEDISIYLSTSGSSGKPKLAAHVAYTWLANTRLISDQIGIDASSVYFCDRPFGWGVGSPRTFFASGATRVFVDTSIAVKGQSIDQISEIIAREACTHAYLPGYIVVDLLARPDLSDRFATVQAVVVSGERIPKTHGQLIGRFCQNLCLLYGSTEMNGVSTYITDDPESLEDGLIGQPMPGLEMKIVDQDGNVVPKGKHGELCVRSIYRFSEYVGLPEKYHEVLDSCNWFHSGDIGHVRSDGNFVLEGRNSEQISMATMKIFPFEIEKELCKAPGVVVVMAVPVPDMRLHNAICACVVFDNASSATLKDVEEFCNKTWAVTSSATGISFRPKYFLQFKGFITNENGKFDRKMMAAEAKRQLDL